MASLLSQKAVHDSMPSVLGNLTHGSSTGKCVVANSLGSPLTLGGPDGNVEAVQFCGTNPGIVGAFEGVVYLVCRLVVPFLHSHILHNSRLVHCDSREQKKLLKSLYSESLLAYPDFSRRSIHITFGLIN